MAIASDLVTATENRKFSKCCVFVHLGYDDLAIPGHLMTVHGRPSWTSLSSMGDFTDQELVLLSMNIFPSFGVILGPTCSIGSRRCLWTNWSWTNFLLPYQCVMLFKIWKCEFELTHQTDPNCCCCCCCFFVFFHKTKKRRRRMINQCNKSIC